MTTDTHETDRSVPVKAYRLKAKAVWDKQLTWRPRWKEQSQFMMPSRGKFLDGYKEEPNRGERTDEKIINGSVLDAIRITGAGLQGGMTSPSRPWFLATLSDKDLADYAPVKFWLNSVRNIILSVMAKSNFYTSTHNLYRELPVFGIGSMLIDSNFQTAIRSRPFTIGEYAIEVDALYRPSALYRKLYYTAEQMVSKFGIENCSEHVKTAYKSNTSKTKYFLVNHVIQPRKGIDLSKADYRGMEFESVYFEEKGDDTKFLRKGGYRGRPFVAPRWNTVGTEVYCDDCPGRSAIGDSKMLQEMEKDKLLQLKKHNKPPMNAPAKLKEKGGTIISGGINYIDILQGQQGFTPAYQTSPDISQISVEIQNVEQRIRRMFFNDLFLAILGAGDNKERTATEIARAYEEKLIMIGPIIEQLQSEMHDPAIDRIYSICDEFGLFPPPPPELEGQEIKIEYLGLLAQAQKLVTTQNIERTAGYVGSIAQADPRVKYKFNWLQSIEEYADANGTPPQLIVPDDVVEQRYQQEQQAVQQAVAQEQISQSADTAKKLSGVKIKGKEALDVAADRAGVEV